MMTLRLFLTLIAGCALWLETTAQKNLTGISWHETPETIELDDQYQNESVVALFMADRFEYHYTPSGSLHYNHIMHRRFRLNSNDAVNSFNTVSVSLSNVVAIHEIKARVIKPDGSIIGFDRNNIREVEDDTQNRNLKIFAIDGIETGDDIEYLIYRELSGGNFGRLFLQYRYPVLQAVFDLSSPENLIYTTRAYNTSETVESSVTPDNRNRLFLRLENVPALKDERYSFYLPRRTRIEYRLDVNRARGRARVLTWNDAAQRIYEIVYDDVEQRELNRWVRSLGRLPASSLEKALHIEEYLKTNITVYDYNLSEFNDLAFVRANKVTGKQGIVRLYANLFRALGINHNVVVTADRTEIPFDPGFESWNYLDYFLIYLPDHNLFIDPQSDFLRAGTVEGHFTATYGLFIKKVRVGDFESAVAELKYIEPSPYYANYDNLKTNLTIDVDDLTTHAKMVRGFNGLSGGYLGRIYKSLDRSRQMDLLKDIMESKAPNPDFQLLTVQQQNNDEIFREADFLIESHFVSPALLQAAGNRILFSIGQTIGPQAELYYDDKRDFGAILTFNRSYKRTIEFEVPQGYRIINPEVGNMHVVENEGEEVIFGFISEYQYQDNRYVIRIDEFYKTVDVKPERFEGFRNVINAAADFNKVTLVLEKI